MENLEQYFACMGTTDKKDLISQLQSLLVQKQLDDTTATFFLDMNNWNLQAAICSYLDFEKSNNIPSMLLICDCTIGEGEAVSPNTNFSKSWRVKNSGNEPWPEGICLLQTDGANMGPCRRIDVPSISPNEIIELSVTLTSPNDVGVYHSQWRMMTASGSYFGDAIWVIVTVSETGTLAVTQQLHRLSTTDVQMS